MTIGTFMSETAQSLVAPHGGGPLKPLLAPPGESADHLARAASLRQVPMTSRETSDLLMLGMGAYSPLGGFMGEADWRAVCTEMQLADGVFWPIPITLSATMELAGGIAIGDEVSLTEGEGGRVLGILRIEEKYGPDKEVEATNVFRTSDEAHPGVAKLMAQEPVNLAGTVIALGEGDYPTEYEDLYLRPAESRGLFASMGWSRVAAFQTRNPMHRSHEHLVKIALELTDGVFIHQVLGKLKPGDIPAPVRTRAIAAMVDNYFPKGSVLQAGYPIEMRYAGPREALLHAVLRQNFGCSHLIVGRDHAGVGEYYGPFDAQAIFGELWDGALLTQALKIDITFYCRKCDGMATARTCPHEAADRLHISGTRQREMLEKGEPIPSQFSRPEVVAILREFYEGSD
jgi:sulfate adenylyltransferase